MSSRRTQIELDDIAWRRRHGETLQSIGDGYGITRERVRQICDQLGVRPIPSPVQYRRFARAVARAASLTLSTATPDDPLYPHGTLNGYRRGCKCAECTRANRDVSRRRTLRLRGILR